MVQGAGEQEVVNAMLPINKSIKSCRLYGRKCDMKVSGVKRLILAQDSSFTTTTRQCTSATDPLSMMSYPELDDKKSTSKRTETSKHQGVHDP